jgi:hypothetical protein
MQISLMGHCQSRRSPSFADPGSIRLIDTFQHGNAPQADASEHRAELKSGGKQRIRDQREAEAFTYKRRMTLDDLGGTRHAVTQMTDTEFVKRWQDHPPPSIARHVGAPWPGMNVDSDAVYQGIGLVRTDPGRLPGSKHWRRD